VFSSADGSHYAVGVQAPLIDFQRPGSAKGGLTHLDQYQAYRKRAGDAVLKIRVDHGQMQAVDEHPQRLNAPVCPVLAPCAPIRAFVRYRARAYVASAKRAFFDVGGLAFLQGYGRDWDRGAATSADSRGPAWERKQFLIDNDFDDSHTFRNVVVYMDHARTLKVPLESVPTGELFAVHVSLDAEAINDRGRESGMSAGIKDPQHVVRARGLVPSGAPKFKEPPIRPARAARCPGGRPRRAGVLALSRPAFAASESAGPLILVTRRGGSHGRASVTVAARSGTARAGRDFASTRTTVRFGDGDRSPRLVEVPSREDGVLEPPETFSVALGGARCAGLGSVRRATVTILDDDEPPAPPSPALVTVGGTVEGLDGPGLVLTNLGTALTVAHSGRFTFPGPLAPGSHYDVRVKTQPLDQACTVEHGAGTTGTSDVTDVAVRCVRIVAAPGLDPTFGSVGRVSTPVGGGSGEAVAIEPNGGIVTVGRRGDGAHFDFAATRHDAAGRLDSGFGTAGIATTDLGGNDDEAFDAAPLYDGGFVAAGRTDAKGLANIDFGVVRYTAAGAPDAGFGSGGIVKTDISGRGDQANAVAVQPDGRIVVAGFATDDVIDGDFALARYNPDGTLDTTFGGDGIVITDFGTHDDAARALALQPDGRIIAAGSAGEKVALARYLADGRLDPSFGNAGSSVADLGPGAAANGVALTPSGQILLAGSSVGPALNRDFMLARFRDDGVLDSTFGRAGAVVTDLGHGDDFAESLAVDSQRVITLAGRTTSPTIFDAALVRYRPDGTLDTAFDADGILTADFHGGADFAQDLALDAAGRVVAAGTTVDGTEFEFALMRANP
jgi:uncharacterized delta-60 repeat protein